MKKLSLTKEQQDSCKMIAERFHLDLLILFGSQITGRVHSNSDFDFALMGSGKLAFEERLEINRELERTFKNVDLCDIWTSSPLLLGAIVESGVPVFQRNPDTFEQFRLRAISQYLDYKPVIEMFNRNVVKQIKSIHGEDDSYK